MTPTQQRMMHFLSLAPCSKDLLRSCLYDRDSESLRMHVSHLRKRLKPSGRDVVCRGGVYTLVQLTYRGE